MREAWGCVKTRTMLCFARRGEICSPEDNSLCVFGQVNPAPTVDKVTGHFSFDIPPTVSLGSTVMPPNLATSVSAPQLQKSHDWQLRESPRK